MAKQVVSKRIKRSTGSIVFDVINITVLILLAVTTLYPFWDSLIVSLSTVGSYYNSTVHLWPGEWSLEPYRYMLSQASLWTAYKNTIIVTLGGTAINMVLTIMGAYVLSKKDLKGRRVLMFLLVFTMMFTGGIIPTYIIVDTLRLTNTLWAMVLPTAISTYNLIILRGFFYGLPAEIEESALIDGCNDIGVLFKIVIPISKPGIMTIALFYAVDHWNNFFSAVMYITNRAKWPLQLFLRSMLFESEASFSSGGDSLFLLGQPMKMAAVMVAIIPIMCFYPFFQKHFTKGVMSGAVKG